MKRNLTLHTAPTIRPIHTMAPTGIGNRIPSKLLKLIGLHIHQEISEGSTRSIIISKIMSKILMAAQTTRAQAQIGFSVVHQNSVKVRIVFIIISF